MPGIGVGVAAGKCYGAPSGGSSNPYPTIANSLLWVDRFRSCTDASGLVPAVASDSVQTIPLPSGWGASLGDGLVRQASAGARPVYLAGGLKSKLNITTMSLPATLSLSGAFTLYTVIQFNAVPTPLITACSGSVGTYGGVLVDFNASGLRCFSDDASTYIQAQPLSPVALCMVRIRRTAANNMFFAATGLAEVAKSSTTYAWQIDRIMSRGGSSGSFTDVGVYLNQWVLVNADTVTAGTDAAIQSALIARETGLVGIS